MPDGTLYKPIQHITAGSATGSCAYAGLQQGNAFRKHLPTGQIQKAGKLLGSYADHQPVIRQMRATSDAASASSYANSAFDKGNNALPSTGGTITGSLSVSENVVVSGNLTILGSQTTLNTTSIILNDPFLISCK
jgi:hypothetical protein